MCGVMMWFDSNEMNCSVARNAFNHATATIRASQVLDTLLHYHMLIHCTDRFRECLNTAINGSRASTTARGLRSVVAHHFISRCSFCWSSSATKWENWIFPLPYFRQTLTLTRNSTVIATRSLIRTFIIHLLQESNRKKRWQELKA